MKSTLVRNSFAALALAAAVWFAPAAQAQQKDVVDTAVAAGNFRTFATALQTAGLIDALKGKGPFTLFAPTDEAFAKIPRAELEALLKDKQRLTAVLTHHVVSGKLTAADAAGLKSAKTLQGGSLTIDASDGFKVDGANVVKADIACTNGVIHVIDTVVLPK
ncbi:MAG: fasciclin domain-containing protein [Vicinamibacteria bacterium]